MPVPPAQNNNIIVSKVLSNSSSDISLSFSFINLKIILFIPIPSFVTISPKCINIPIILPITTASITAGIFFISMILEILMAKAQAPKIILSFSLKSKLICFPKTVPIIPPINTHKQSVIIPIGIFILLSINTFIS